MASISEDLKKFWSSQGIGLRPGAPDAELVAFEVKHDVRLPADLREYLASVNGFDGSEHWMTDDEVITFWGLMRLRPSRSIGRPMLRPIPISYLPITVWGFTFLRFASQMIPSMRIVLPLCMIITQSK